MSSYIEYDKKGHVCPPSDATHPSGRWETLFVYAFICKFTTLRAKVHGLETPMDFEEALLSHGPNDVLGSILGQFVVNLKPQTRNLSMDQISTTVASVLSDYFKSSERTVFWNEDLGRNVDPFVGLEGGFFSADWDFKLKILRQLVELQLSHNAEIKATIDRAWGVSLHKHKKKDVNTAPPDASDPKSQERLQMIPIGQNSRRTRYWVVDDSPRVFTSTNPWKITATSQTVSSTREEYQGIIEELKATAPGELKKGEKRTKIEQAHLALISALEGRIETIDSELARVARVKKKQTQRKVLLAQAEIRETRTRRLTHKPDYVYADQFDSEEEYQYQADAQDEEFNDDDFLNFRDMRGRPKRGGTALTGHDLRRSSRTATKINTNGKRESSTDTANIWHGERRSTRQATCDHPLDLEPPFKRARTEESTISGNSRDHPQDLVGNGTANCLRLKSSGAAALRPTEIALEEIAGKKRSKFWVYAVEPIPQPTEAGVMREDSRNDPPANDANSNSNHYPANDSDYTSSSFHNDRDLEIEGSLSPLDS